MNSSGLKLLLRPMLICQRQQHRRLISTAATLLHKHNKMPLISATVLGEKRKGKDVSF